MKAAVSLVQMMALVALTILGGCSPARQPADDEAAGNRYSVSCTISMVADIVRHVAGNHAKVTHLIGSGVDPHLYKPTRSDVIALMEADIIFYSGLRLEGKMSSELDGIARQNKPVIAVTERLEPKYLLSEPDDPDTADPHVWMDVQGWMQATEAVRDALIAFDPPHADEYAANATAYLARLEKLDAYAKEVLASIPEQKRLLITAHDAFRYLGRAYGIEVLGIQGLSTESEAGLQDVNRLVDLIVERDIGAIFVESSVARKNVEALIQGARSRDKKVLIGGELFSDAMGAQGTYEGSYIGMIDHNVTTIARALGGQAPEGGMQGKLAARGTPQ